MKIKFNPFAKAFQDGRDRPVDLNLLSNRHHHFQHILTRQTHQETCQAHPESRRTHQEACQTPQSGCLSNQISSEARSHPAATHQQSGYFCTQESTSFCNNKEHLYGSESFATNQYPPSQYFYSYAQTGSIGQSVGHTYPITSCYDTITTPLRPEPDSSQPNGTLPVYYQPVGSDLQRLVEPATGVDKTVGLATSSTATRMQQPTTTTTAPAQSEHQQQHRSDRPGERWMSGGW